MNHQRNCAIVVVAALLLSACGGEAETDSNEYADSALYIPRTELTSSSQLTTTTGKTWTVIQTPMLDSSLVNIVVYAAGYSSDTLSFALGETDPVTELRLEDLDKDGFQELYIVTQSPDNQAFGTVYGFYPEQDESIVLISFEGATPYTMKEGEPYEGYRGHDKFSFDKGTLTNSIPVFRPDDADESPGGGTRTIAYELTKGNAVMRLRPSKRN